MLLSSLVRLVTSLRGADFWSRVSSAKSWWFTEWLAVISERGVVYRMKRMGPSIEPWSTQYMSCNGEWRRWVTDWSGLLSERYDWNHWSAVDWMPKTEFRQERRIWWSVVSKACVMGMYISHLKATVFKLPSTVSFRSFKDPVSRQTSEHFFSQNYIYTCQVFIRLVSICCTF